MRILITGSSGFVGRHLVAALDEPEHELVLIDTLDHSDALEFFARHREGDIDLAIHCAAFVAGRYGIDNKSAYLHAYNSQLDAAFFGWVLRNKPARSVYFSSSAAYPIRYQTQSFAGYRDDPLHERDIDLDSIEAPEATYGRVKLAGEQLAASARLAGCPVTVLRPFSGYGEDQAFDYPFPTFIDRARLRMDPFTVWGDGTQMRDWIHIDDVVGATLEAAKQGIDGPVNLCTGIGTDFTSLAKMICAAEGYNPPLDHVTNAHGGVAYRVGNPTLMESFYTPKITLEEGISRAIRFAR